MKNINKSIEQTSKIVKQADKELLTAGDKNIEDVDLNWDDINTMRSHIVTMINNLTQTLKLLESTIKNNKIALPSVDRRSLDVFTEYETITQLLSDIEKGHTQIVDDKLYYYSGNVNTEADAEVDLYVTVTLAYSELSERVTNFMDKLIDKDVPFIFQQLNGLREDIESVDAKIRATKTNEVGDAIINETTK